jgi:hypothetical protein
MRKIGTSVQVVVLLAGAGAIAFGCSSSGNKSPGGLAGSPGTGGAGGGGFGPPKDGGVTDGAQGGAGGGFGGGGVGGGFGGGGVGGGFTFPGSKKDGGAGTGGAGAGGAAGGAGGAAGGAGGAAGGAGGAAGGPVIGNNVTLQDLPLATAWVLCEKYGSCCVAAGTPVDVQGCASQIAMEQFDPLVQAIQASVAAGRLTYRGDKWAACLNRVRSQSCDSARMSFSLADMMASCEDAFAGKVAAGGACMQHEECAVGYCSTAGCTAKQANGVACEDDAQCASDFCGDVSQACETAPPAGGLCN